MTRFYQFIAWNLVCSLTWGNLLLAAPPAKAKPADKPVAQPAAPVLAENKIRSVRIMGERVETAEEMKALQENRIPNIELIFDLDQANCYVDAEHGKPCGYYFKAIKHVSSEPKDDVNLMEQAINEYNANPENKGKELMVRSGVTWLDYNASNLKLFKEYNDLWKEKFGDSGVYVREGAAGMVTLVATAVIALAFYKLVRRAGRSGNNRVARWFGINKVGAQTARTYRQPIMFGLLGVGHVGTAIAMWRGFFNPLADKLEFGDVRQERLWLSELMDTSQCYAESDIDEWAKGGTAACLLGAAKASGRANEKSFNFQGAVSDEQQAQNQQDKDQDQRQGDEKPGNAKPAASASAAPAANPLAAPSTPVPDELKDFQGLEPSPAAIAQILGTQKDAAAATQQTQSVMLHPLPKEYMKELAVGPDKIQFAESALKTYFIKYRRKFHDVTYEKPSLQSSSQAPWSNEQPK